MVIRTCGSSADSASATAIAGSTWPAVPPPANTTDRVELTDNAAPAGEGVAPCPPVGCLIVPFTRNADLPMRERAQYDAGRRSAGQIHDAFPGEPADRPLGVMPTAGIFRAGRAFCRPAAWRTSGGSACGRGTPRYDPGHRARVAAAAAPGSPCRRARLAAR